MAESEAEKYTAEHEVKDVVGMREVVMREKKGDRNIRDVVGVLNERR